MLGNHTMNKGQIFEKDGNNAKKRKIELITSEKIAKRISDLSYELAYVKMTPFEAQWIVNEIVTLTKQLEFLCAENKKVEF